MKTRSSGSDVSRPLLTCTLHQIGEAGGVIGVVSSASEMKVVAAAAPLIKMRLDGV
jgi:hypothetical protein